MSTLTATTSQRPVTVTAAAALLAVAAVVLMPIALMVMEDVDAVVVAIGGTLATLKLIAAVGLWRCRRWAFILGFVATLLDTLLTVPGLFDGTVEGGVLALWAAAVVIGIATLILLILPASRRAYL